MVFASSNNRNNEDHLDRALVVDQIISPPKTFQAVMQSIGREAIMESYLRTQPRSEEWFLCELTRIIDMMIVENKFAPSRYKIVNMHGVPGVGAELGR